MFSPIVVQSAAPTPSPTPKPTPIATRKPAPQPTSSVRVEPKATPKPKTGQVVFSGGILKGKATYMCDGNGNGNCHYKYPDTAGEDHYAAAGPALRKMLGPKWRNDIVLVMKGNNKVYVKLVDWCECKKGTADERIIDLYADAFDNLADLGRGKITVRIQEK